jgi:hypothetical protein
MKNLILSSSLLFVLSCAGFSYKYYGVSTDGVPVETLKKIKLVAGKRGDTNKTLAQFDTSDSDTAKLICTPVDEFRLMRQALLECENGNSK